MLLPRSSLTWHISEMHQYVSIMNQLRMCFASLRFSVVSCGSAPSVLFEIPCLIDLFSSIASPFCLPNALRLKGTAANIKQEGLSVAPSPVVLKSPVAQIAITRVKYVPTTCPKSLSASPSTRHNDATERKAEPRPSDRTRCSHRYSTRRTT